MLYALVFVTRYLDLPLDFIWLMGSWQAIYNICFKIFYLASSAYVVFLMMKVFPRTRERERAWKLALWSMGAALVLAPISIKIFKGGFPRTWFLEVRAGDQSCRVSALFFLTGG